MRFNIILQVSFYRRLKGLLFSFSFFLSLVGLTKSQRRRRPDYRFRRGVPGRCAGPHRLSCQVPSRLLPLPVAWFRNLLTLWTKEQCTYFWHHFATGSISESSTIARVANSSSFSYKYYRVIGALMLKSFALPDILDAFSRLTGKVRPR